MPKLSERSILKSNILVQITNGGGYTEEKRCQKLSTQLGVEAGIVDNIQCLHLFIFSRSQPLNSSKRTLF